MKKTEAEQTPVTDAELDAALAQMAEEVPPMPADFHDRWMNAVRAEAGNAASAEEPERKQPVSVVRLTRILSVAAVFLFLIGGTLLYRNTKKTMSVSVPSVITEETEEAEEAAAETCMQTAAVESVVEETFVLKAAGAVQNASPAAAKEEPAAAEESTAEEADYFMDAAAYEAAPAMEAPAFGAVEEAAMPAPTYAPIPEPTALSTPKPTAAQTAAPTAVPAAGPEQADFLPAAGEFFTDMGDFLLAALPYLLVLAVPAVTALVIRRRKNRKGR
ncbi:MAG: hypothetical protein IKG23_09280 [Clostridia bacterium]|nr:hypothetical protein [Clostridia bacterium]